jgi:VWFA-related protein
MFTASRLRLARASRISLVASLIVAAVTICANAQNDSPTTQASTLQVSSRLVILDVRVVDAAGHFVRGLDRSQFTVYEDRVPQSIVQFDVPLSSPLTATPEGPAIHSTADLLKHDTPYVNVLVIDELNTPLSEVSRARSALIAYLDRQPAVLPVPTLFVASGASRLAVLNDFTQDRDALLGSLKAHVSDVDFRALSNQLAGGSMSSSEGFSRTLGALSQLANSLRGVKCHKNVLWVGSGFDHAFDLTSAGSNDSQAIEEALRTATTRMLEARMSLSTLDPAGMDAQAAEENVDAEATVGGGGNSLTSFTQGVSFDELARTTGGAVVHGRNDLLTLVKQTTNAAGEFYTIAYKPTSDSALAADFRQIRVVMKNPSFTAITRTGYFPTARPQAPFHPPKRPNKRVSTASTFSVPHPRASTTLGCTLPRSRRAMVAFGFKSAPTT